MSEVTYSKDVDIAYVYLTDIEEFSARTVFLDDLRLVDYADDGRVIGVEFINASGGIDLTDVPAADVVEKLIVESGHPIKILA